MTMTDDESIFNGNPELRERSNEEEGHYAWPENQSLADQGTIHKYWRLGVNFIIFFIQKYNQYSWVGF
jgi:hypothetical protein